jgi:hypothetical protein
MDALNALYTELQEGLAKHLPTSGEYRYYAKQITTLRGGVQTLLKDAAVNTVELRLHILFYEAEALSKEKENDNSSRIAEIEKEASELRAGLLARIPRIATPRVFATHHASAPPPS